MRHFGENKQSLTFKREILGAADLQRFIDFNSDGGRANDEVINIFVAIFNSTPNNVDADDSLGHYGSIFGLSLPPRNFKVLTTFFYVKLKELLAAGHPVTGNPALADEIEHQLVRWFKNIQF